MKSNQRRPTPDVDEQKTEKKLDPPESDKVKLVGKEEHIESEEAALPTSEDQLAALAEKLKGTSEIAKFEQDTKDASE